MQYGTRMGVGDPNDKDDLYRTKQQMFRNITKEFSTSMLDKIEVVEHNILELRLEIVTSDEFSEFLRSLKRLDLRTEEYEAVMTEVRKTFGGNRP